MNSASRQREVPEQIRVIDTHTGGEPTRVVLTGGPDLGTGSLAVRCARFQTECGDFRSAVVNEPRGFNALVGALLCDPADPAHAAGVVFFNNVGVLGMCGHGTMGVAVALARAGRIETGQHVLETPVGNVTFRLHEDRERVTVENVASYRHTPSVTVRIPGHGVVTGDVAWGGNWFFLTEDHGQELSPSRIDELSRFALSIRQILEREGVRGRDDAVIDHIELFGPTDDPSADGRSFVLCPGGAWDRSPCGTGTSAKVACLVADGKLREGDIWRQQSIIGSVFEASYRELDDGAVIPSVTGAAWITAESTLLLDGRDPFRTGVRV